MNRVLSFADEGAQLRERVGGKGANLGVLAAAGLPVPPGFTVTTDAYVEFIEASGAGKRLAEIVGKFDYSSPDALERDTAEIRELLTTAPMPDAIATAITEAYHGLDPSEPCYVAVRSSGTAEDTAEASFAGLHDTYLDIRGDENVLDAVRRCWASLWTARATSYRNTQGFAHEDARLAVVIQQMVDADVAGVMFTANPMTGSTSETVINASWGLGESVVSGAVTPDQLVVGPDGMTIRSQITGDKATEIVRDPDATSGTITRDVEAARQRDLCLGDDELAQLVQVGRHVTAHYGSRPQDIEWAIADGAIYLLQSRDVTGTTISWDDDVDSWQTAPDDDEYVWSRAYADEYWTGAITPLFYSVRAREFTYSHERSMRTMGFPELAEMRLWKYHKAEAYVNSSMERHWIGVSLPKFLRGPGVMAKTPSTWWDEIAEAPFSLSKYLGIYARIAALEPTMGVNKWIDYVYEHIDNRVEEGNGLSDPELQALSDDALKRYMDSRVQFFSEFLVMFWPGFFVYAPGLLTLLGDMLGRWYTGTNTQAFADLVTGLPKQTITLKENEQLWRMAKLIRESSELTQLFESTPGAEFFVEVRDKEYAAAFVAEYDDLLEQHGHRGQADRDFWFPRRIENPASDYNSLKTILTSGDSASPSEHEAKMRARRETATAEIVANIKQQPLGFIKAEIFKLVLHHTHKFLVVRDDERHYIDRLTWSKKRCLLEINRRIVDRDLLDSPEDFYFLSLEEVYEVLDGKADTGLVRSKIAGRRQNFERFDRKEYTPPPYIVKGEAVDLDAPDDGEDAVEGVLTGLGTSPGNVTGPARVVRSMDEIGRVEQGDIMVCQATDPGWTPVFLVIAGLVLETGGMLAHGSCLSREYGLPAVQIRNAMSLIEDGQTITVNGETGAVTIGEVATVEVS